jgi:predicted RNA methylase
MSKSVLTPEVRAVLENSRIEGNNLYLPEGQLERKLYQSVDKHIKNCGGKWNRSAKAHVFESCPKEKLGMVLEKGVSVDEKTLLQAFYTPKEVAERAAELLDCKGLTVLEPSAGAGALIDAAFKFGAKYVDWVEIDSVKAEKLKEKYGNGICQDFLSYYNTRMGMTDGFQYQRVLINPPFTKNQDIKHVLHAIENWLAPGGRLVAIMPAKPHPKLDKYNPTEYEIEAGAFKESGTMVKTKLVVIDL